MPLVRTIALGVLTAIAVIGCDAGPGPTASAGPAASGPVPRATSDADRSAPADPGQVLVDQLGGPWRVNPIIVDDAHVAIVSDACAAAAREKLGEVEADLPTALVDARGEHLVIVIMADDLNAIECLAHLDATNASATVDSVDRLSATAVAPVDRTAITIASVVHEADRPGGRTVAFGRVGPQAADAKVGFGDNTVDVASKAEGWWAIWWPGVARANSFAATDNHDIAVGRAHPPSGEVEARVLPAAWWLDPNAVAPTAAATEIHALVLESACVGGKSPEGRIEPPTIEPADASVTVTFEIRRLAGEGDCVGNTPFPVVISLPEPLGKRTLLDGSETPPREAGKPPSG